MSDFSFGMAGGVARFDSAHGRQEGGMNNGSLRYPSPFFDIGHTYLPTSVKQMFRWCRYYQLTNPLISAVNYKMSEYPITQLIFDDPDPDIREKWRVYAEENLKIRTVSLEAGLDYYTYGNCFITLHFPFEKYLTCRNCKFEQRIEKCDYKFRNLEYNFACPKCQTTTEAKVRDNNVKQLRGIKVLRWNPEYITLEHNEATGDTAYFLDIPQVLRNDIMMGKRHIVETIPDIYVQALKNSKTLRFTSDNMFHFGRPTIAQKDHGWGTPLILPVLKDTYYLQILRKAQECIAQAHIVPLRLLFPQAGSATSDPYTSIDLGLWRKRIEGEIQKWRVDPNYIPILPLPIGNETVGGEGKSLMLHQEMRSWSEQIVAGMGVPIEFIFGGLSYSGSNVSMRMLENSFISYRTNLLLMVRDFILGRVADYMGYPRPKCHFSRFKMADDLQRANLLFQLNQAQKISDTTLLRELDYDLEQEEQHKKAELSRQLETQRKMQLTQAALQGEVQLVQAKYQAQVQKLMMSMGVPMPGGQAPELPDVSQMGLGAPTPGGGSQQPQQGDAAASGMPSGATVYPENAAGAPDEGVPGTMMGPEQVDQQQGGKNLLYLARRASTYLQNIDEATKYTELLKMKGMNPQLYTMVTQLLNKELGSQANPLDAAQSPMAQQKPPRSPTPLV